MAMTHDYLDYLNDNVGIAPANSQEELHAAQTIASLMRQHDVEPQIEEFDAPALSGLAKAVLSVAMLLGMVLVGTGVGVLVVVGFVLSVAPAVLAVLRMFGREVPLTLGPSSRSQNVVALHRATGPMVTKGNRPIVVVAHYDTPHENLLYSSPLAPYLYLIAKASKPCAYVVAFCALIQVLGFLPASFRGLLWAVGIIACVPSAVIAVGDISERVLPCTLGANDNKSSVAALLGVLENVRPSGAVPLPRPVRPVSPAPSAPTPSAAADETSQPEPAVASPEPAAQQVTEAFAAETEGVRGVRHGEKVLREVGMLPETCEVVYVGPAQAEPRTAPASVPAPADAATAPAQAEPVPAAPPRAKAPVPAVPPAPVPPVPAQTKAAVKGAQDGPAAPAVSPSRAAVPADPDATHAHPLSGSQAPLVMDEGGHGVGPKDLSGLTNTASLYDDMDATRPTAPIARPEAPSDPEWGKTSYRPQLSSVARRASLFDLPDPSASGADPFSTDPAAAPVQAPRASASSDETVVAAPTAAPTSAPSLSPDTVAPGAQPIGVISADSGLEPDAGAGHTLRGGISGFFSRLRRSHGNGSADSPNAKSWLGDDADGDDGSWRGGAAPRAGLRLVGEEDGSPSAPSEEDLREEVLHLGDDALISHDVWFVALGASELDHAGMRSFLARHRQDVRGCFVVNLDSVGAGALSLVTHEGLEATRRSDRRLGRMLLGSASALHLGLGQVSLDWRDTDATPAMRSSLRSVTLMGVGANGLPALSHTGLDVPDAVDGDQAANVAQVVTELIRRS